MRLGYWRRMYVEFTTSTQASSWRRCQQHACEYLGGVAQEILHDKLKTAVVSRGAGGKVHWTPHYLDCALYSGFSPPPCKPYGAQTKGKVERSIGYVQQRFGVGPHLVEVVELNAQVLEWLQGVAKVRLHGPTRVTPVSRCGLEDLQALPGPRLDTRQLTQRRATRDCTVQ